jgi:hypothetical protein
MSSKLAPFFDKEAHKRPRSTWYSIASSTEIWMDLYIPAYHFYVTIKKSEMIMDWNDTWGTLNIKIE